MNVMISLYIPGVVQHCMHIYVLSYCAANVTENIITLLRQCQECLIGIKQPTLFLPPVSLHSLRCSFLLLELLPQLLLLNEPFLCRIYELHDLRAAAFALEPFSLFPEQSILLRKLIPADTSDSSSLSDTSYLLSYGPYFPLGPHEISFSSIHHLSCRHPPQKCPTLIRFQPWNNAPHPIYLFTLCHSNIICCTLSPNF